MQDLDYSLVAKITENCNLNCIYCYEKKRGLNAMSLDIVENLIQEFLKQNKEYAHFTWIGGEPLIRGQDFFRNIQNFSKKHNFKGIPYSHSIQTNGYNLTPERFKELKELGFKIGVSYDGHPDLQDKNRGVPLKNKIILENIKSTKKGVGLISVLTKDSIGKVQEIYNFLKEHTNFAKVNFYSPTGRGLENEAELLPPKEEAKKISLEFYELWKNDDSHFILRPYRDIVRSFFTGLPVSCSYSAISCYKIVASDVEGNIYNCSRATSFPEMKLGNIKEGLENLLGNKVHNKILERFLKLKKTTNDSWFNLSAGGCPIEALSHKGDFMEETYYGGEIRNGLFEKIKEDLKDERTRKKLERKAGLIK